MKMTNEKKFKDFSSYCKYLLRDAMLTGIAPVVLSSSRFEKLLRILFLIFCVAGFMYQTTEVLQMYWRYSTVVDESTFDFMTSPAITICDRSPVRRRYYCNKRPEKCVSLNRFGLDIFCSVFKQLCDPIDPNSTYMVVPTVMALQYFLEPNFTEEFGLKLDDSLLSCSWFSVQNSDSTTETKFLSNCSKGIFHRVMSYSRFPVACYVINSSIGDATSLSKWVQDDLILKIKLRHLRNDFYFEKRDGGIEQYGRYQISVHPSYKITNPFYGGFTVRLDSDYRYKIDVYQKDVVRLPPPYYTDCFDYLNDWVRNGGHGPVNREECQHMCEIKYNLQYYGCVGTHVNYPHEEKLCGILPIGYDGESDTNECKFQCKPACKETEYVLKPDRIFEGDESSWKTVEIHFHPQDSIRYKHLPQCDPVELFSLIAGYIGLWLGWSLVAVFDFLGLLLRLCKWPFLQRKQKKKDDDRLFNRNGYRY